MLMRGQQLCNELLRPKVTLTGDGLVVTATKDIRVAERSDLPPDETRKIAPLGRRLRGYREHFRQVRVGELFDALLDVTLDPALEPSRVASVLLTAATAGYTRIRLHVASETLTFTHWVPPNAAAGKTRAISPLPDPSAHASVTSASTSATVPATAPSALVVGPEGDRPGTGALCIAARGTGFVVRRGQASAEVSSEAELGAAIARVCPEAGCAPLVSVETAPGARASDLVRLLAVALDAPPLRERPPPVLVAPPGGISGFATGVGRSFVADAHFRPCTR